MEIVNMKIGEVHPYENNPRVNDDAVEQVADIDTAFSWMITSECLG